MSLASDSLARDVISGPIKAKVLEVRDGDSLVVLATIWPGQSIKTHVRILGLDAPELKARCAVERVHARLARQHLMKIIGREPIFLSKVRGGKYFGRVLADVSNNQRLDIKSAMIEAGVARPYRGRKRQSWCMGEKTASLKRLIP